MRTKQLAFFVGLLVTLVLVQESQSVITHLMSQKYRKPDSKSDKSRSQQQQPPLAPEDLDRVPAGRNQWKYSGKNGPYQIYQN